MSKRILVLYYSQTGQLKQIVNNFCSPFINSGCDVEFVEIVPKEEFKFPWNGERFFDAMPECVLDIPIAIKKVEVSKDHYDLIVIAWQPWFLSPSLPIISALKDSLIKSVVNQTPVITICGARNMWISAQQRIRNWIRDNNGIHVGNLVLRDRHHNLISGITIQYWLFKGKKDKMFGVFPKPGISDADIESSKNFGAEACERLLKNEWKGLQKKWIKQDGISVSKRLMFVEYRAIKIFTLWAKLIRRKQNRKLWINIFRMYLLFALFLLSPIVILLFTLIIQPIFNKSLNRQKDFHEGVNLQP